MHWPGPGKHLNYPPVRMGMDRPKTVLDKNKEKMVLLDGSPTMRLATWAVMAKNVGLSGSGKLVREARVCNFSGETCPVADSQCPDTDYHILRQMAPQQIADWSRAASDQLSGVGEECPQRRVLAGRHGADHQPHLQVEEDRTFQVEGTSRRQDICRKAGHGHLVASCGFCSAGSEKVGKGEEGRDDLSSYQIYGVFKFGGLPGRADILESMKVVVSWVQGPDWISAVLANVCCYYDGHRGQVEAALQERIKRAEDKIKEYVKMARWKDTSFWSVKIIIEKTRKTLHKTLREFEKKYLG